MVGATDCCKCHTNLQHTQQDPDQFGGPEQHPSQCEHMSQEEPQKAKYLSCAVNGLRWIGRLWGFVLIVFLPILLLFNYSSFPENSGHAYLIVFTTIVVGMIVVWWREGLGALLSLAGLAGFYVAVWTYERSNFQNWVRTSVCVFPSIVFLLASSLLRRRMAAKSHEGPDRVD